MQEGRLQTVGFAATRAELDCNLLMIASAPQETLDRIYDQAHAAAGADTETVEVQLWYLRQLREHAATAGPVLLDADELHGVLSALRDEIEHLEQSLPGWHEVDRIRRRRWEGSFAGEGASLDDYIPTMFAGRFVVPRARGAGRPGTRRRRTNRTGSGSSDPDLGDEPDGPPSQNGAGR